MSLAEMRVGTRMSHVCMYIDIQFYMLNMAFKPR